MARYTLLFVAGIVSGVCMAAVGGYAVYDYDRGRQPSEIKPTLPRDMRALPRDMRDDAPPQNADLGIPDVEDKLYLKQVLREIFPHGSARMSDEQRAIAILRYVAVSLELKDNDGTATKILQEGYSICGGTSLVFCILCREARLPARYVGQFYLPFLGSHATCEVFYDGRWHFFDPTFGIFFYTHAQYDGKGVIVSSRRLHGDPYDFTPIKAVDEPWTGKFDEKARTFGLTTVDPHYVSYQYNQPLLGFYRDELASAFPVACGHDDLVSMPIDADLAASPVRWYGKLDGDWNDMQNYNPRFEGSSYVGRGIPNMFHTWLLNAAAGERVKITYHSTQEDPPALCVVPLRAAVIVEENRKDEKYQATLRVNDRPAIFAVHCRRGQFLIDAIHAAIEPVAQVTIAPQVTH